MDDPRDRVLAASVMAVRRRCEGVEGAEVLEPDGLVLSLTNVPEPSLNAAYVEREPSDPVTALAWAVEEMGRRGTRSRSTTRRVAGRDSTARSAKPASSVVPV